MQWTDGRRKSFIVSTLRSGFRRWPPKYETLNEACIGKRLNESSGREAKHYKCNNCHGEFPAKQIQIDHINPIVKPEQGFISWDEFIDNLFCQKENLQALCATCHKEKTKEERTKRKNAS